jgi:hypothetical protein
VKTCAPANQIKSTDRDPPSNPATEPTRAQSPVAVQYFTAARIGRVLGKTKRAVIFALSSAPSKQVMAQGGVSAAWTVEALPSEWQAELAAIAQRRLFPNVEALLLDTRTGWQPPIPLSQVDQKAIDRAVKLRKALARPLTQQHAVSGSALNDLGLADYRRAFGHTISAKQWRRLLDRATRRDGGLENWRRLDLYIDDAAFRRSTPKRCSHAKRFDHHPIDDVIAGMESRDNPTLEDKAWLLHEMFKHYESLIESGAPGRHVKSSLIAHVYAAVGPRLSKHPAALAWTFSQKLNVWIKNGRSVEAIQDKRRLASGNFSRPDFSQDEKRIRNLAVQLGGNETAARRQLQESGQLSAEFCTRYPLDLRSNKSYLPKSVRDAITPQVEATLPLWRGPKQARMSGAYITRDWSNAQPGDWFTADDVTWNHYFKIPSSGGWLITRGECLLMTDYKTDYPLGFLLIPGKYNGQHIRKLALHVHDKVGLPRKGFTFERGVWKSRFVVGEPQEGWEPLHWRDAERGLSDPRLGLEIRHATTPRSKTIEGLFHHLQDRMRSIHGFVGFNEREEKMERVQQFLARANRGDKAALEQIPTQEQWIKEITAVLGEFVHAPSNGARLDGQSPAEAWNKSRLAQPLKQLAAEERHILATHQKIVGLHPTRGIVLKVPGRKANACYVNEQTAALVRAGEKKIRVLIDIEQPELLTCFDMKGTTSFTVKGQFADAVNASREQLAELSRDRRAHAALAREVFGEIQHEVRSNITRESEGDEETKQEGRIHNAAVKQHHASETDAQKLRREINTLSDQLGETRPDFTRVRISLRQLHESLTWKLDLKTRRATKAEATQ